MKLAQVSLPLPFPEPFTYRVPEDMELAVGQRVRVPFGKRRLVGVVTGLGGPEPKGLRAIEEVLDGETWLSPALLKFTRWVADYYLAGWGEVLPLAFPPLVSDKPKAFNIKVEQPKALDALLDSLKPRQAKSKAILEKIASGFMMTKKQALYEGLAPALLKTVIEQGMLSLQPQAFEAPAEKQSSPASKAPPLKAAQAAASLAICQAIEKNEAKAFLLFGATGSGKTEVYLKALDTCLAQGQSAIVLVPEIALTPQTWSRFESRFPGQLAVLHSGLSPLERARSYRRLRLGTARVALGARSALFAPVAKLGLIVVDEESEPSFKQENSPRYHARDAALIRAKQEGAVCVLGSATPSFEAFENARAGKLDLLRLPERVGPHGTPKVTFSDLADLPEGSRGEVAITPMLAKALAENLGRGEQSLIFLNRRGFAPVLACRRCGKSVTCPQCSISLTFHQEAQGAGWLRCHLCGHGQRPPKTCLDTACGHGVLRLLGTGTQRLEDEVKQLLPRARVKRVDRDVTSGTHAHAFHEELGNDMRAGKIDILVGTQMLAKGLDFPDLTLVGVINADASLAFPDFRAEERAFQLLVQVAGRAGRAAKPGRVIIQTRQSEHPVLVAAARQDFEAFFNDRAEERKELRFPPFARAASLTLRSLDKDKALAAAQALGRDLDADRKKRGLACEILGPAPCPLVQIKGWWRYRLLVRSPRVKDLHQLLMPQAFGFKKAGVFMAVDIDPVSFL